MSRFFRKTGEKQEGITGIETAITLIAFVSAAAVVAYLFLTAGVLASPQADEAGNEGGQATTVPIELRGSVVAKMESSKVTELNFNVGIPAGGSPIDFTPTGEGANTMVISYSDADKTIPVVNWTVAKLTTVNDDNLLETNELFRVTVVLPDAGDTSLSYEDSFSLEIKPPDGPVIIIEQTVSGKENQSA